MLRRLPVYTCYQILTFLACFLDIAGNVANGVDGVLVVEVKGWARLKLSSAAW